MGFDPQQGAWVDLCTNHKDLIRAAFRNCKLTLKIDGSEDNQ